MEKIPTAKELSEKVGYGEIEIPNGSTFVETCMIEFAKMHVEAMMKDMEQKLLDTLDDNQYFEENVCGVIEEIRGYKSDNIK
jgi:hypothetical protein